MTGTIYFFRIFGIDQAGNELRSDGSFSTLEMPRVENLKIESILDRPTSTIKVTWITNVETTTSLRAVSGGDSKAASSDEMTKIHEVELADLQDNSTYTIVASGRDQFGNTAESNAQTYTTPLDTRPPKIDKLTIESSKSETGEAGKAQVVVSWETDEPATSQVEYAPGVGGSGTDYTNKTPEQAGMATFHVVVLGDLDASKPYHLRALSKDAGNNLGSSDDNVVITEKPGLSILDLIIKSLTRAFGWMTKINVFGK